jgi:hypothetical protein
MDPWPWRREATGPCGSARSSPHLLRSSGPMAGGAVGLPAPRRIQLSKSLHPGRRDLLTGRGRDHTPGATKKGKPQDPIYEKTSLAVSATLTRRDLSRVPRTIYPTGERVHPRGNPIHPRVNPVHPGGNSIYPRVKSVHPRGEPIYPRVKSINPRGNWIHPRVKSIYPRGGRIAPRVSSPFRSGGSSRSSGRSPDASGPPPRSCSGWRF